MFDNMPERMLPPKDTWPDFVFTDKHSRLLLNKDHINCAEMFWDIGVLNRGLEGKVAYYMDGQAIKFREVLENINKMGNALRGLGVKEGDRVVFRFGDDLEAVITQMAVWKIGGICVPTQPLEKAGELEYIFNDTECKVVITHSDYVVDVEKALENSPAVEILIVAGDYRGKRSFVPFHKMIDGNSVELEVAKTQLLDVNSIYYTGGTTGRPKGSLCTHAAQIATILDLVEVRGTQVSDVHYCPLPVGHGFGNLEKTSNIIAGGITSILNRERYTPDLVVRTIEKYRVTKLIASPTVLRMISSSVNLKEFDLSSLRLVCCSGEYFDKKTFEEWTKILGFEPWNGYGMSPLAGWFITPGDRGKKVAPGRAVGLPLPGYEVRIVDKDGKDLPEGESGVLLVRGPSGICFLKNKHPDIERYIEDDMNWGNYSRADDYFKKNEDGWLEFQTRASSLIRSAGRFIDPIEIEEVLRLHPAVSEVVVIPSFDEIRGEVPKANIILTKGFKGSDDLSDELRDFVKSKVAAYKYPRKIEFVTEILKDGVGKVQRKKIADMER